MCIRDRYHTLQHQLRSSECKKIRKKVYKAAKIGDVHKGYEKQVGERGLKLPDGEEQRVAIARTISNTCPCWHIRGAYHWVGMLHSARPCSIRTLWGNKSYYGVILRKNARLLTAIDADGILVMEDHKTTERWVHYELITTPSSYLWHKQHEFHESS